MIGLALKLFGWVRGNPVTAALVGVIISLSLSLIGTSMRLKSTRQALSEMTALRTAEAANHRATKANYAQAQADAAITHTAAKRAVETHWKDVAHDTQIDLRARLDAALAAARVQRTFPTGARSGSATGQAQPAPTAAATSASGGACEVPQLDAGRSERDVLICTENTVKAQGWQRFYEQLGAGVSKGNAPPTN